MQEHRPDAKSKDHGKVQVFLEENQGMFSVFPSTSGSVFNLVQEIQYLSCSCDLKSNSDCLYSGHGIHAYFFFKLSTCFALYALAFNSWIIFKVSVIIL